MFAKTDFVSQKDASHNRQTPSFSDLRPHYRTGRAYTIRGEGRNRVTGYCHGIKCNLGDIELADWTRMAKDLIASAGEQELHQHLLDYLSNHNYARKPKSKLLEEALELHVARIFDNPAWVSFISFNKQYRPEALNEVHLIWILPECCNKPGQITQAAYEQYYLVKGSAFCPHCGRMTNITVINMAERISDTEAK